jgi:sporulation protein YlmC with PRC-barrel domain
MRKINGGVLAISLFLAPVGGVAQTTDEEARAPVKELMGSSEIHSQTAMPSLTQTAQATSTTAGSAETTVSIKSLLDAKVLDSTNREMGTIRTLLVEPQTGKLVRADIVLKGGGLLGKGGEQQFSVPWEQLAVKRHEGSFVLVLNQQAMERVQSIQKQESSGKQEQQPSTNK